MFKPYKLPLAALALLFSAFANGQLSPNFSRGPVPKSISQPAPTVVFIGDWVTYNWSSAFAANPNWINKGTPGIANLGLGTSEDVLASFQANVVSLHPAIVHIMIGLGDSNLNTTLGYPQLVPGFLVGLDAMVQEAKAANIKVILGTEPPVLSIVDSLVLAQINSVIASYGAANNIPVINYAATLCACIGSTLSEGGVGIDIFQQYGGGAYLAPPAVAGTSPLNDYPFIVTTTGYAVMTQMAETTINTMNLTLVTGWLSNVQQFQQYEPGSGNGGNGPGANAPNVNTVEPGAIVQFTPVGYYSDGSQHPLLNTSFQGSSGTWTSSNPLVMYVNQAGLSWATSPGTAIIRYTSPSGVPFSEWIMYVKPGP